MVALSEPRIMHAGWKEEDEEEAAALETVSVALTVAIPVGGRQLGRYLRAKFRPRRRRLGIVLLGTASSLLHLCKRSPPQADISRFSFLQGVPLGPNAYVFAFRCAIVAISWEKWRKTRME